MPGAVEGMLRVVRIGPSTFTRVALTDVELSTGRVAAGETVFPVLPAANYDPAVFPDPNRIDVSRPYAASHLTFGHGMHYCLGAPLARLELTATMHGLVTRFPRLHLAVPENELTWPPTHWSPARRHCPSPGDSGRRRMRSGERGRPQDISPARAPEAQVRLSVQFRAKPCRCARMPDRNLDPAYGRAGY